MPYYPAKPTITVTNPGEKPWIGVTLAWFDRLGISYSNNDFEHYTLQGGHAFSAFEYTVPGDFSSIAYPIAAALITKSSLTINNIDMSDAQGDKQLINLLIKMGAKIQVDDDRLIVDRTPELQGCDIDVNDFIDALPILAVIACYTTGSTRLLNAGIARQKECDRLSSITTELQKMGANITEQPDSLTIQATQLKAASVNSHKDHRIAMSLIAAAMGIDQASTIGDVDCIAKSYPNFIQEMQSLGAKLEVLS